MWRLLTTFVYFGPLSLNWILHMFFLVRYCRMLEDNSFRGRTADMIYMLVVGAALLLVSFCAAFPSPFFTLLFPGPSRSHHQAVSPWFRYTDQLLFLGSSLTFMLVYVWSRRNPSVRMGLLALFFFRYHHAA